MPEVRLLPRRLWPRSEVVETPGRGPGGSRFESGRSPHHIAGDLGSARSHTPCPRVRFPLPHGPVAQLGSAAPLQGEGCGFESRTVHHRTVHHADVAQRERHGAQTAASVGSNPTVSTTWTWRNGERTGFGSRGLEVRALPSRPMRGGGTGTTPGSEPGGPRSNRGLAAIDASAVVALLDSRVGLLRRRGFLHS